MRRLLRTVMAACTLALAAGHAPAAQKVERTAYIVGPAGDQLMGDLRSIGETMTQEWLEAAGAEGQAIVDAYRAAAAN